MTIDKIDTPILEQIQRPPQAEGVEGVATGIEQVRDIVKLESHAAALAQQTAEIVIVRETSKIREDRTFSKEDVAKLIVFFAMIHNLELADLKVSRIINDKQGVLLSFQVRSPNPDGGYQLINYTIKGRHERAQSRTTSIDRTFWDKDDNPESGTNVAEYLDGKWYFKA